MTTEPNNVKKLQQRNYNLVVENEFLKDENNRLNEFCTYWEREHDVLAEENEIISQENKKLKEQNETLEKDKKAIHDIWKKSMTREEELKQQITQLKHKNNAQSKAIVSKRDYALEKDYKLLKQENQLLKEKYNQIRQFYLDLT